MEINEDPQCDNRGRSCSSFCGSACRSIDRSSPMNQINEFTEECPLKVDKSSECKLGDNRNGAFRALICCLILLLLAILGALVLNLVGTKTTPVPVNSIISNTPRNIMEKHGAVASDYAECSHIGTTLLREGGNAIDAAVAAAICLSVVAPHKTGLGGGGKMMIYSHRDRTNPLIVDFVNNTNAGIFATAKVRVPGFLRGLEFAQSLRGNLSWGRIVEPAARLARDGFVVTSDLANEIGRSVEHGMLFGHLIAGETLQLPVLAETLEQVGRFGCDVLYNGTLSRKILRDAVVQEELLHELSGYEPRVSVAKKTIFHNHAIYLPSQANAFRSSIETLEGLRISNEKSSSLESQVLAAVSLFNSVAENSKILKNLERERYSAVAATDYLDIYVSIVTGLSAPLGLAHMTGAGFLLDGVDNDNGLDFLSPIIFHNEKRVCGLRGVFGTDDPTLVAQILYNLLLRSLNVSTAIEYPRFYVFSDGIAMESDDQRFVDPSFRAQLESSVPVSHVDTARVPKSVNAITKHEETISSYSDSRGEGRASRY